MLELTEAELEEGLGLVGDRYQKGVGQWQLFGKEHRRNAVRQLSLIAAEAIEAAALEAEQEGIFTPADTRRNIVTRGLKLGELVNERFLLGKVAVRGVEICTPCARPSTLVSKKDFVGQFPGSKAGLRVEVLDSGIISAGDIITLTTLDQVRRART